MDILIKVGSFEIKWYSILILIAFIIGYCLVLKQAKRQQISKEKITDLCYMLVPICILGARLYYVIFEWNYYSNNLLDALKIWEGGLAIHGGIIAGILYLIYFCKKNDLVFLNITDIFVPSLILGQAIGRWGNFFNQEAYGPVTTYSFLKKLHIPKYIIDGMYINFEYRQPTFLYESIFCLIGFIVIIIIKKLFKIKSGQLTAIYFIYYGILRFFIESLRQDSLMFLNIKMAQLVSVSMIIIGLVIFAISTHKKIKYRFI